jgi:hypothetical protein
MHPAFNSSGTNRGVQVIDDPASGRVRNIYSINVERYLDIPPTRGEAILGQAEIQVPPPFPSTSGSEMVIGI